MDECKPLSRGYATGAAAAAVSAPAAAKVKRPAAAAAKAKAPPPKLAWDAPDPPLPDRPRRWDTASDGPAAGAYTRPLFSST